jgi:hypothetical protein
VLKYFAEANANILSKTPDINFEAKHLYNNIILYTTINNIANRINFLRHDTTINNIANRINFLRHDTTTLKKSFTIFSNTMSNVFREYIDMKRINSINIMKTIFPMLKHPIFNNNSVDTDGLQELESKFIEEDFTDNIILNSITYLNYFRRLYLATIGESKSDESKSDEDDYDAIDNINILSKIYDDVLDKWLSEINLIKLIRIGGGEEQKRQYIVFFANIVLGLERFHIALKWYLDYMIERGCHKQN